MTITELRQWREDYYRRGQLVQPVDVTDRLAEALPHLLAIAEGANMQATRDDVTTCTKLFDAVAAASAAGLYGEVGG
jgi:hypothetical protein